jgi:hypothetical protein
METVLNIPSTEGLTFEKVWLLFQETDKKFQESRQQLIEIEKLLKENSLETEKRFKDTDKRCKEIQEELGGIGKSNGEIAEDFFCSALEYQLKVGKLEFDYIDRITRRKRNNLEAEYDIILYNNYKVLIIAVQYNFKLKYLRDFYTQKLKSFKKLYPEYKDFKIYGGIAAMTFEKNVKNEAMEYGFYILSQNNDKLKLLNPKDFEPSEIK